MAEARELITYVVDDEPVIAETLATILRLNGYAAIPFTNPHDVLSLAQAQEAVPDLIITDVSMPQMSGIDFAIKMKELCPTCSVLLFSGHVATADLLLAVAEKGHHFEVIAKPVHPKELLSKLKSLEVKQAQVS